MATNSVHMRKTQLLLGMGIISITVLCILPWQFLFTNNIDLSQLMSAPSFAHPLGTDQMGRDLFLQLRACFLQTVLPLWGVSLLATFFGFITGFVHVAYVRPRMWLRPFDWLFSVSTLLLVSVPVGISAFSISLLQTTADFSSVAMAIALIFFLRAHQLLWSWFRESEHLGYWQANKILGGNLPYRVFHYGIRQAWTGSMIETTRFHLQIAIGIEASLSYLGFGIQEPNPSFGNILSAHLPDYIRGQWHVVFGVMIAMTICALLPSALANIAKISYLKWPSRLNPAKR